MRHGSLAAAFFGCAFLWGTVAAGAENKEENKVVREERAVAVGVEDILRFDFTPSPNFKLGMEGIIVVDPANSKNNEFRVYPQKKGITTLTVFDEKGETRRRYFYNVTLTELSQKIEAIRNLLYDVEGITIKIVDDKIVIDGELIVPRDLERISQVQTAFSQSDGVPIVNLVTISKITQDAIAKRIQDKIRADEVDGQNVNVIVANQTFILKGTVENSRARERAEMIAITYLPEFIGKSDLLDDAKIKKPRLQNLIEVQTSDPPPVPRRMMRVTWHFVEIGKEFLKSSFFKWTPLVSEDAGLQFGNSTTGGVATSSGGSFAGTIRNLLPKLQSGSNGGFARVLFSVVGIGIERSKIKVSRVDNVPYIAQVVNGVPIPDVTQAKIEVEVVPQMESEDKILLDQHSFNFSAIVGAGAGSRPRTVNTSLGSNIIIRSGESAVLGGLISNDMSKDIDRDPSGATPQAGNPIFNLLRSKAFRNKKSQFVVFVTPKVITDAANDTNDIKSKLINTNKRRQRSLNQ